MEDAPSPILNQDLTGQKIGGYEILRKLGSGGMADVYLAQQESLDRQVALKVLQVGLANDKNYVRRFFNEARAAASLIHPNIVQIYEVGKTGNYYFIAQEYVPGKNLAEVVQREGALEPGVALDMLRQVVSALCKAYELNIVHRDIKPENIMLSSSGEIKVADFGLARMKTTDAHTLTQVGVAMGTPLYMSPEQIEGRAVDSRSDIYSLGITTYFLLSGHAPYRGDTALAIAVQHINNAPERLENIRKDLPSGLTRIVHQMLAKNPDQRFESPNVLLSSLRDLASKAVKEGWAEADDNWSLAEWIATDVARTKSGQELDHLMKEETRLRSSNWRWSRMTWGLPLMAMMGFLVGVVSIPDFHLQGSPTVAIPKRASAAAQLYHAKQNEHEEAWKAVWEKFPDADPYLHQLARQGLVRNYLLVTEEFSKAVPVLLELEETALQSDSNEPLLAFALAGLCISYERMGMTSEAQAVQSRMTTSLHDILQREPQIYELYEASKRRLDPQNASSRDSTHYPSPGVEDASPSRVAVLAAVD